MYIRKGANDKKCKIKSKGAGNGSHDPLLEFSDPPYLGKLQIWHEY